MTAYVNDEQKKEGAYGKAVKATLAATLAAGMVPAAAAFAAPADETAENYDIELLGLTPAEAWNAGTFTVTDNNGSEVALKKDFNGNYTVDNFVDDGKAHYLLPEAVVLGGGAGTLDLTDDSKYKVTFTNKSNGHVVSNRENIAKPGTWTMKVECVDANSAYKGCTFEATFTIAVDSANLDNAELFQVAENAKDFSDKTFEYKGAAFKAGADKGDLGVVLDGKALKVDEQVTVEFYPRNNNVNPATVEDAGQYTAVIKGMTGTKYEGSVKRFDFEVSKLDLSKAVFDFGTIANYADPTLAKVNGEAQLNGVNVDDLFDVAVYKPAADNGEYKYTISLKAGVSDDIKKNIVEGVSGTYTAVKADKSLKATDFFYNEVDFATKASYEVKPGGQAFDLSKIVVKNGATELDKKYYKVTVLDKDGNEVDAAKLKETGVWTVKVTVDAAATGYAISGEQKITVDVKAAEIASKDVVWKYDGELLDIAKGKAVKYDGSNLLENLDVTVSFDGKELAEGTDYKMVVTDKKTGEKVESVIEEGEYKIVLESDTYTFAGKEELELTVGDVEANEFRVAPASILHQDEKGNKIGYTGEAIVPAIQYLAGKDKDGKDIWKELPADAYTVSYKFVKANEKGEPAGKFESVKEMKELGFYEVYVRDANSKDSYTVKNGAKAGANYQVVEGKVYSDVAPSDWFYTYVYDAENAKYMFGIGNSDVFAPYLPTSRAMAAEVLFRMGGGAGNEGIVTPPFSDVADVDAWYFNSVAWASSMKIISGYPGTTEFRPGADVTRAEFCIMMQRYAAATGQGVALEAGEADEILAKYEDGASVPAWAKDAVAWAVKNEIFGGYKVLDPTGNITRAQMAKMTTVFQPKALDAHKALSI